MKEDTQVNIIESRSFITEDGGNEPTSSRKLLIFRLLKTFALFYSWICLGLYAEVLGPSLPTFMNKTNSDYEQISVALSIREIGMFIGSLVGAFFADRFISYRNYTISVTQLLGAITIISIPYCTNISSLCATLFFSGCAHGAMTSNGNPLLGLIWGENAGGAFNFMHSGYGVGGALAPVLLAPFTYASNFTLPSASGLSPRIAALKNSGNATKTDLVYMPPPCFIIGACCFFATIAFLFFGCCNPISSKSTSPSETQDADENEDEEGKCVKSDYMQIEDLNKAPSPENSLIYTPSSTFWKRLRNHFTFIVNQKEVFILLPSIFFLFFALVGNERVFSKFVYVAALSEPVNMSSQDSYLLTSAYWITFCLARILTVFVSFVIPVRWLFLSQLIGAWGMSLGLLLAPQQRSYYFAFSVLFGLFKSPLFPTGLSVINETVAVSGLITLFVNMGSSIGASSLQYLAGYLIQIYSPKVFPLVVMVTSLVLLFIGVSLLVIIMILRRRKLANSSSDM